ncbi:MAG: ATP-binding protein [Coriobacteriales bacterium]|jgi:SpoVK/Ycf46/Vps4 family AAA+-type ATPase|nr:ATP-binding protein [Coriobacteriales bacterium]
MPATETNNPFTPTFGSIPPQLAGRQQMIRDILGGLDNAPGDPNRTTIFTGARGTGKTVLLAKLAEEASAQGWVSANVTAREGLLEEVLMQVKDNASDFLAANAPSRITGVEIAGFGISRSVTEEPERTWRSRLTALVKDLNEQGVGLLITVDEVDAQCAPLRDLVDTYQHLVRERRDVALVMAGLPNNISQLLQDKKISFLRRAFQHRLDAVPNDEVAFALRKTIETSGRSIGSEALGLAAESTQGFPFMIQLVGYNIWRQNPQRKAISLEDTKNGIELAGSDMRRMIFESTIHDLSEQDIRFLVTLARINGESDTAQIAAAWGRDVNYTSKYRRRLLEQGIIGERMFGKIDFDIPLLSEYILERFSEF